MMQLANDRGRLRMERLRQLELEQLQWEQDALVMPEALDRALFLSFESVKTEFSDLDGLSWPRYPVPLVTDPWAVEEPTPKPTSTDTGERPVAPDLSDVRTPAHSPTLQHHPSPHRRPPYASSSHADVPLYSSQDTVRVSRLAQSPWGHLQPANQFFSTQHGPSHEDPQGHPYTLVHPPKNMALACHCLRPPAYRHG